MRGANNFVSKAKLDAATAATIAANDVADGVIDDPIRSTWDPQALVGTAVGKETFTAADAEVFSSNLGRSRSRDGKRLCHGDTRGTNLSDVAGTEGTPLTGKPRY